jgi:hypothetical protein
LKSSRLIYSILAGIVAVLVIYIAKESFFQPGMDRFDGKYEELGNYRNENNTGPIVRLYAVKVLDNSDDWMKEYGNSLPHTKYGRTIVFFFGDEIDQKVELSPKEPYYMESMKPYLIASYEKTPMGEVRFKLGNE